MDIDNDAPDGTATDDLRSALASAVAEHSEPSEGAPGVDLKVNTAGERTRDPAGRFAAKEPESGQTAATPSAARNDVNGTAQAATRKAPTAWKTDHHEAFGRLDPAIQEYILERESQMQRGLDERAPKVKAAEDFERLLSPHAATMQRLGLSGHQAIERLLQVQTMLDRDPVATIRQLAQQYRVNLGAQPQQPGAAQPQQHPVLGEVARLAQTVQAMQQERQQAHHEALQTQLDDFKASSPHFEEARGTMADLMRSGQATDLKDAYEKACWLVPTIREKLLAERAAPAADVERGRADQAAAQRARAAASSVRGAPTGSPTAPSNPKASLRDEIRASLNAS